jgi:hypothetical protein
MKIFIGTMLLAIATAISTFAQNTELTDSAVRAPKSLDDIRKMNSVEGMVLDYHFQTFRLLAGGRPGVAALDVVDFQTGNAWNDGIDPPGLVPAGNAAGGNPLLATELPSNPGGPVETNIDSSVVIVRDGGVVGIVAEWTAAKDRFLPRIRQVEEELKNITDEKQRAEKTNELGVALDAYFVQDMRERVLELDKIKAKVAAMEQKLQTRLDRKSDILDLQLKQILYKLEGLDLFIRSPEGK